MNYFLLTMRHTEILAFEIILRLNWFLGFLYLWVSDWLYFAYRRERGPNIWSTRTTYGSLLMLFIEHFYLTKSLAYGRNLFIFLLVMRWVDVISISTDSGLFRTIFLSDKMTTTYNGHLLSLRAWERGFQSGDLWHMIRRHWFCGFLFYFSIT